MSRRTKRFANVFLLVSSVFLTFVPKARPWLEILAAFAPLYFPSAFGNNPYGYVALCAQAFVLFWDDNGSTAVGAGSPVHSCILHRSGPLFSAHNATRMHRVIIFRWWRQSFLSRNCL